MSELPTAREEILGRVRAELAGLRARSGSTSQPAPAVMRPPPLPADLLAELRVQLARAGARLHEVRSEAEAARQLETVLAEIGARRLAHSDEPLVRSLAESARERCELVPADAPREVLFECDAGLTSAQWAIAETGTLVLDGERERHRLVSLVPPAHIALLPASRVLATLDDACARLSAGGPAALARAITFITGPSRTADIEMRLVVGVHGPEVLHVILLHDGALSSDLR